MRQDQIDNSADTSLLADLPVSTGMQPPQLINLNGEANLQVLAGLLDINISMVYAYRQNGRLPPNSDATYRDCIKHHMIWLKNKASQKASNLADASLLQEMKLREAKIEREWLAVKKAKEELLDINVLAEHLEPIFIGVRTQLCSIARRFPETQESVDGMLAGWEKAGQEMFKKADTEMTNFIGEMVTKELELDEVMEQAAKEIPDL